MPPPPLPPAHDPQALGATVAPCAAFHVPPHHPSPPPPLPPCRLPPPPPSPHPHPRAGAVMTSRPPWRRSAACLRPAASLWLPPSSPPPRRWGRCWETMSCGRWRRCARAWWKEGGHALLREGVRGPVAVWVWVRAPSPTHTHIPRGGVRSPQAHTPCMGCWRVVVVVVSHGSSTPAPTPAPQLDPSGRAPYRWWEEGELRDLCTSVGLQDFRRQREWRFIMFAASKPADGNAEATDDSSGN